ncbi:MAG: branched-chain amino acid ABC transporter permease [Nocardioides sp.]|nr:branched-chain amino acid ABC transporter permease [Nocardioides sp.]
MDSQLLLSQFVNGLGNGLIYFLIAVGFTLVFGLMNFVNFAHGAFFLLGAYVAHAVIGSGVSFWLAMLLAPLAVGLAAAVVERLLLRRLYVMSHTYQIVATFALALGVQELVTLIWGPYQFTLGSPEALRGTVDLAGVSYPVYRIFVVVLTAVLALALWVALERTRFGAMLRAGSQDTEMVASLGINIFRLFSVTFAGAAALAALGGVLSGPMRGLGPTSGNEILGLAVVVVVVGGIGSYGGALVAALVIAEVQSLAIVVAPSAGNVIVYVLMAAVLLFKSDVVVRRFSRA